jgi:hypothetical protein
VFSIAEALMFLCVTGHNMLYELLQAQITLSEALARLFDTQSHQVHLYPRVVAGRIILRRQLASLTEEPISANAATCTCRRPSELADLHESMPHDSKFALGLAANM